MLGPMSGPEAAKFGLAATALQMPWRPDCSNLPQLMFDLRPRRPVARNVLCLRVVLDMKETSPFHAYSAEKQAPVRPMAPRIQR